MDGAQRGRWGQYQANSLSSGFLLTHSTFALKPQWTVAVGPPWSPEDPSWGPAPVLGPAGTIYAGNLANEVVAVTPQGAVAWRTKLPARMYAATPAVAPDGMIYVITTIKTDAFHSALHQLDPVDGRVRWSTTLPDGGFVSGSPKLWIRGAGTDILVNVQTPKGSELFAFDQTGAERARRLICRIPSTLSAGTDHSEIAFSGLPTPAVVGAPGLTTHGGPIVVVADHCTMQAFEWNPGMPEFARRWGIETGNNFVATSSPSYGGILVVGGRDVVTGEVNNRVIAYDVRTGARLWDYDATDPAYKIQPDVRSTPAFFGIQVYLATYSYLHVVDFNGAPIKKLPLFNFTQTSPALGIDYGLVHAYGGLYSFAWDLSIIAADFKVAGGFAAAAIGDDGTTYVVSRDGTLRSYPGP